MLNKIIHSCIFFLLLGCLTAQSNSNIYQLTMSKVGQSFRFKSPKFLTQFNKQGYNNQPCFFSDNEVYFTTDYYGGDQTEIAKFELDEETLTRITYTEEKEYSPTPIPGREEFSVVRVEADNETQTLSFYPKTGIGFAKRYMNNTSNIGYHNWLDSENLALFLVEPPHHNLAVAHAISERRKIVLDKIGRCLKVSGKGKLYFVHKQGENDWWIKAYDQSTSQSVSIIKSISGVEDFELLNDGSLLMGKGSKLFWYKKGVTRGWKEMSDFSSIGIKDIKRIAVRKNNMLLVTEG